MTEELTMLGKAYYAQKQLQKQISNTLNDLREKILARMESLEVLELRTDGIHIIKSEYAQDYFDKKQFKENEPELCAKYTEKKTYTKLTVNEVPEIE